MKKIDPSDEKGEKVAIVISEPTICFFWTGGCSPVFLFYTINIRFLVELWCDFTIVWIVSSTKS